MLDTARVLHKNVSVNISVSSLLVYKPEVVEDSQKLTKKKIEVWQIFPPYSVVKYLLLNLTATSLESRQHSVQPHLT